MSKVIVFVSMFPITSKSFSIVASYCTLIVLLNIAEPTTFKLLFSIVVSLIVIVP